MKMWMAFMVGLTLLILWIAKRTTTVMCSEVDLEMTYDPEPFASLRDTSKNYPSFNQHSTTVARPLVNSKSNKWKAITPPDRGWKRRALHLITASDGLIGPAEGDSELCSSNISLAIPISDSITYFSNYFVDQIQTVTKLNNFLKNILYSRKMDNVSEEETIAVTFIKSVLDSDVAFHGCALYLDNDLDVSNSISTSPSPLPPQQQPSSSESASAKASPLLIYAYRDANDDRSICVRKLHNVNGTSPSSVSEYTLLTPSSCKTSEDYDEKDGALIRQMALDYKRDLSAHNISITNGSPPHRISSIYYPTNSTKWTSPWYHCATRTWIITYSLPILANNNLYRDMVIELSETMGCGCSISPRQVNPSESPSSSMDHSWTKKPNGGTTSAGSQRGHKEISVSPLVVNCGVDTRSLEGFLANYLTEYRDSKGVQCDFVSWRDASTSPRPGLQVTSGQKRLIEIAASDSFHRSFSTESLWRYADSPVGQRSKDVATMESTGNLREYLNRTSGFQSPAKACSVSYGDITGPEVSEQDLSLGSPEKDINANPLPLDDTKREMSYHRNILAEQSPWPPEFQPRPPLARKEQLMSKINLEKLDQHSAEVPEAAQKTVRSLVKYLTTPARNDLEKSRTFYYWITHNIKYDINCADLRMTSQDTLESGVGVCRNFCRLFSEMCRLAGIRVQEICGFVKGFDYSLGHRFKPDEDVRYYWNAVFLNGFWRFIDCTWGAGILNTLGRFQQKFNEHFFIPDPDQFSWTHFPYREAEGSYSRWQLLETPQTLDDFNAKPKVTPYFFTYSIKILSAIEDPASFAHSTEVLLSAPQIMKYKYKFCPIESVESKRLNAFVFCQLKNSRLVGSFKVTPPEEGDYLLKVYATPEGGTTTEATILNSIISMVLRCTKTHKNVPRFPFHDGPWGITSHLAEYGLYFTNVPLEAPILVTVNGRRTVLLEVPQEMLISQQLFDVAGNPVGAKNIIHRVAKMEDNVIRFVIQPPRRGLYKFVVYARPKPTTRGRWYLPCIGTFLVECRQESLNTGVLLRPKRSLR